MRIEKESYNTEFDVIHDYDEDNKVRVKEGILFEAKPDGSTMMHIGTDRPEVFNAFFEAAIEMMDAIMQKNNIVYDHTTHDVEYNAVHTCPSMQKLKMKGIKVTRFEGSKGWYFVDENVKVEGQDGACYGTAIINCPFCGEEL